MTTSEVKALLNSSITQKPPFCVGTIALLPQHADLFYKHGIEASWIDMSRPSDRDLENLAKACNPATFGLDQRDVLDETYRKAGKMDTDRFSAKFDLVETRLIERIRVQLLSGFEEAKPIRAELYKLNVYGKDSFFKAHKDTPRSETMFGSLVIVYPTRHEGGALLLRHGGKEWSFDSAEAVRSHNEPAISYVAFYSDVEHEIMVVQSGYRVTLTYNLYFEGNDCLPSLSPTVTAVAPDDHVFQSALVAALKNPAFLPEGGVLGFGLAFSYPVSTRTDLKSLLECLKGSDAVIKRVCDHLSLDVSLRAIYEDVESWDGPCTIMVDQIVDLGGWEINDETTMFHVLCGGDWEYEGKSIYDYEKEIPNAPEEEIKNDQKVLWITPLTAYVHCKTSYISPFAMGNEAAVGNMYGDICLMVNVGPRDQRETKKYSALEEQGAESSIYDQCDSEDEESNSSLNSKEDNLSTEDVDPEGKDAGPSMDKTRL